MLVRETFGGGNVCLDDCCLCCTKSAYMSFLSFVTAACVVLQTLLTYLIFSVKLPNEVVAYGSLPLYSQTVILGVMWGLSQLPNVVAVLYMYRLERCREQEITDELFVSLKRYVHAAYALFTLFVLVTLTWSIVLFVTTPEYHEYLLFSVYVISNLAASCIDMNYKQMKREWIQHQNNRAFGLE